MCYSKKDKIDCGINSKNEILKKIKIDNKSSQKKTQHINNLNNNINSNNKENANLNK